MDCSPPGSSVYGISQTRILEWVAISTSTRLSSPRDWICFFCVDRQILYHWATRGAHLNINTTLFFSIADELYQLLKIMEFSHILWLAADNDFLWKNIPLYELAIIYLFILTLVNHLDVFSLGILWIMLLWDSYTFYLSYCLISLIKWGFISSKVRNFCWWEHWSAIKYSILSWSRNP